MKMEMRLYGISRTGTSGYDIEGQMEKGSGTIKCTGDGENIRRQKTKNKKDESWNYKSSLRTAQKRHHRQRPGMREGAVAVPDV